MTAKGEAISNLPAPRRSFRSVIAEHPVLFTLTALAGAAVAAIGIVLGGGDSDEAPIRVKNGSLDLYILSASESWEQQGSSGNWRIASAERYKEEFEVTVAARSGASCGGVFTATGSDIVITINNKTIRLQSAGKRTLVKPDSGVTMTWDATTPQKLSYRANNTFIQAIAVGNGGNPTTMCTFTAANQLDHMIILNVP
jgi:hypothetical protein